MNSVARKAANDLSKGLERHVEKVGGEVETACLVVFTAPGFLNRRGIPNGAFTKIGGLAAEKEVASCIGRRGAVSRVWRWGDPGGFDLVQRPDEVDDPLCLCRGEVDDSQGVSRSGQAGIGVRGTSAGEVTDDEPGFLGIERKGCNFFPTAPATVRDFFKDQPPAFGAWSGSGW